MEHIDPKSTEYLKLELYIMRCESTIKCLKCKQNLIKAKKYLELATSTAFDELYKYEIEKLIVELDYLLSYFNCSEG